MTFDLFSSILCSGSSAVAADAGEDSRDLGWEASRVISSERERKNALVNHKQFIILLATIGPVLFDFCFDKCGAKKKPLAQYIKQLGCCSRSKLNKSVTTGRICPPHFSDHYNTTK